MSASVVAGGAGVMPPPMDAAAQLHTLIQGRETLYPFFKEAWAAVGKRHPEHEAEAWAKAVLALLHVNAGPACLMAFWTISRSQGRTVGMDALLAAAAGAAGICRRAGAAAAAAALEAHPRVQAALPSEAALRDWWQGMERLAAVAPESIAPLVTHAVPLLAGGLKEFEDFVAAGLRVAGPDRERRRAFFSLDDPLARRIVAQARYRPQFGDMERELGLFLTALWGSAPRGRRLILRGVTEDATGAVPRRANIAPPLIRLPAYFPDLEPAAGGRLFLACTAHAGAHLALGGPPFRVGSLQSLQVALVTLIEDARIEAIAMQRLPGLRSLWGPYHTARADDPPTATGIMARLARALFDPNYIDDNGVVAKGRRLFAEAAGRLDDPAISREIGGRLGNDIGQMRLAFNARTYLVEPAYRDDGFGIWDFDDDSSAPVEMLELATEAVRLTEREVSGAPPSRAAPPDKEPLERARPAPPDDVGPVLATYPEWDAGAGLLRPDWTTVKAVRPSPARQDEIEALLRATDSVREPVRRLVRSAHVGRLRRLKRQADGHDLDLDAMLEAGIALRTRDLPDLRVFRRRAKDQRDVATVVLIDTSMSTGDQTGTGGSVLDVERVAVAALAEAMASIGDAFGLLAFASNGRGEVRVSTVKPFEAPYDSNAVAQLAGLRPGFSTRLGAALRHAGTALDTIRTYRKLIIVLSDGQPSDVDIADPADLAADARHAVLSLRRRGIDSFGVLVGAQSEQAPVIFGLGNTAIVTRIEELPNRLAELYFRLARR